MNTQSQQHTISPEPPPQLPKEPDNAYAAFVEYFRMGPGAKLRAVGKKSGLCRSRISQMKREWHWDARIEQQPCKEAEDWSKQRAELRRTEWVLHQRLVEEGMEALRRWHESDRVPSLVEIARVVELASRLGRLACGLPLSNTEVTGVEGGPIRIEIEAALQRVYGDAEVKRAEVIEMGTVEEQGGER